MATNDFVPCTADDWYQRRRQDDEGKFFVSVANQGPRKGENGGTRQGIYCLTADGELLTFKNAGQSADATRDQLKQALKKFQSLPEARRGPGQVTVPAHGKKDPNYSRDVPEGGLIVRVNARILDKKDDGFAKSTCEFTGGDRASRDFLWLTAAEQKLLSPPPDRDKGTYDFPPQITRRIARFHLLDNTRGEPDAWKPTDVRQMKLSATIQPRRGDVVPLIVTGDFEIRDHEVPDLSKRGFEGKITGMLEYDLTTQRFTRFDMVALGEHWGCSTFTKVGMRPGKGVLGIAFGLTKGDQPADRVAPQFAREWREYLGK